MTKADLIVMIAQKAKIKKAEAERAINTFISAVKDTTSRGERFTISGFGSFFASKRLARQGRNPKTGQTIQIPATQTIRFRASAKLKKRE
jgi:DNA-binding protein HU-beta